MANKTIYVADVDLPIFEKARDLSKNNLSAVILEALKHYIHIQDLKNLGYEEIMLKVKQVGVVRCKKFIGRKLASDSTHIEGKIPLLKSFYTVYQTAKGNFVLEITNFPDWRDLYGVQNLDSITPEIMKSQKISDISAFASQAEYKMEVYNSLERLKEFIPEKLANQVEEALKPKDAEFLDI